MKFTAKINLKEFIKLNYTLFYRKGIAIYMTIIGVLMLSTSILYFTKVFPAIFSKSQPITYQPFFGFFLVIGLPLSVYFSAKKSYASTQRLQEEIEYEFSSENIKMTGESFKTEMNWDKTYKIEELSNWFLIYQSKKVATLIPKNN